MIQEKESKNYYEKVGAYYDDDAVDFERRYWQNDALQRIRQSFREHVRRHQFENLLEVGFGPGFDLVHFAKTHPQSACFGIDISAEMVRIAQEKIDTENLQNARVGQGSVEDVSTLFPEVKFDMIYVFFGALNTVEDLPQAMEILRGLLKPGGKMVLTFVNKYYVGGMVIELLKLKPKFAFARLKKVWGGYSPTNFLASRCYATSEIKKMALPLNCTVQEGYSILFPAWYYHKIHKILPEKLRKILWKIDRKVSRTVLGTLGEYVLYEFQSSRAQ